MVDQITGKVEAMQIQSSQKLDFTTYTNEDGTWQFFHSSYPMSNSKEIDMITD